MIPADLPFPENMQLRQINQAKHIVAAGHRLTLLERDRLGSIAYGTFTPATTSDLEVTTDAHNAFHLRYVTERLKS